MVTASPWSNLEISEEIIKRAFNQASYVCARSKVSTSFPCIEAWWVHSVSAIFVKAKQHLIGDVDIFTFRTFLGTTKAHCDYYSVHCYYCFVHCDYCSVHCDHCCPL